jgi:flagellar basal body-associated protein FliL
VKLLEEGDTAVSDKKSILMWIFLIIVAVTCLICLIVSTSIFTYNQIVFNKAHSNAAEKIGNQLGDLSAYTSTDSSTEMSTSKIGDIQSTVDNVIEHLQQLQILQKNAASNDVMSFLYSILSTILVGVCAGFVAKSNASAKEAREYANESKKVENEINNFTKVLGEAEDANKKAYSQMEIQKVILEVTAVRLEILHSREEFHFNMDNHSIDYHSNVHLNECIKTVYDAVKKLSGNNRHGPIKQLQTDLLQLWTEARRYRKAVEKLPADDERASRLKASDWYDEQLKGAVAHCDELLEEVS